jgi:hypothetical protein
MKVGLSVKGLYKGIIRKERIRKKCFQIRGVRDVSQIDKG